MDSQRKCKSQHVLPRVLEKTKQELAELKAMAESRLSRVQTTSR
jgi:hypothetical protein